MPSSYPGFVVSDNAALHREAAGRHEVAAQDHEPAAGFWDAQQDPERAELQREMAEYELHGAELERRWAELIDDPDVAHTETSAELVKRHTRQAAKHGSWILMQLANTLERSAGLAEKHAQRREQAGRADDAAAERRAAKRAHEAAQRARSQAEEWLEMIKNPNQ